MAQANRHRHKCLRRVTVPQTHGPGEEAEVDFGEFMAFIDGVALGTPPGPEKPRSTPRGRISVRHSFSSVPVSLADER